MASVTIQVVKQRGDRMTPQQVVEYFETQEKAAKALEVTQQAIARWVTSGAVPKLRQYQIEKVTEGKLKCTH